MPSRLEFHVPSPLFSLDANSKRRTITLWPIYKENSWVTLIPDTKGDLLKRVVTRRNMALHQAKELPMGLHGIANNMHTVLLGLLCRWWHIRWTECIC